MKKKLFRINISTKRLLGTIKSKLLCTDATFKLNYEGYPLIIAGTVDMQRQFHPWLRIVS